MNFNLEKSELAVVVREGALIAGETTRVFGPLSAEQLNWKPGEAEWSIAQCFEHLVISNRPYLEIFEDVLAGRHRPRLRERLPLLPKLFARMLITTLRPDSGRTVQARPAFRPSSSRIEPAILTTFVELQGRLLALMEASRRLDVERITITSPVLPVITYSLMDACRIIVVHEQNHFVQATRVMASPGFPR